MKQWLPTVLLLLSVFVANAQQTYSRVRIPIADRDLSEVSALGIDVTHGFLAPGRFFETDLADYEIEWLRQAAVGHEIVIADVQAWYLARNEITTDRSGPICGQGNAMNYPTPANFSLGSMAGYFTYQEMLMHLNNMKNQYPDLISSLDTLPGELSIQGRPIYWLRISDNPEVDEDEPELLYTALHHSREPGSLSQLIFFMWYVLENYASDPQIQYLVENTELYFIPCINPDGYIYNQTTNPEGGGLWRKNRRSNGGGSYGVDLNRNYGYQWGFDDEGSSPITQSQTYRGEAPFSEPETRAVRDFCLAHDFLVSLNYHTFGNLLINPWAYSDLPTDDDYIFSGLGHVMTEENNYLVGTGTQTVGYTVNGNADDWMYGDRGAISYTPEVGANGFWPPANEIIDLCRSTMLMNLTAAAATHRAGRLTPADADPTLDATVGVIPFSLQRYGLEDGPLVVSIQGLTPNVLTTGPAQTLDLTLMETVTGEVPYELFGNTQNGEEVQFVLQLDNGAYLESDTVTYYYISQPPLLSDNALTLDQWTITDGNWGITSQQFVSAPTSITDSPSSLYPPVTDALIEWTDALPVGEEPARVFLNFQARWEIEPGFDYAQVLLAVNDGDFFPLCGRYTREGSVYQDPGQPVYDGSQPQWVTELIELTDYLSAGDSIRVRFRMVSDSNVEQDGFYFDDLQVFVLPEISTATDPLPAAAPEYRLWPNPATTQVRVELPAAIQSYEQGAERLYDALGRLVYERNLDGAATWLLPLQGMSSGVYYHQLRLDGEWQVPRRLIVTPAE